MNDHKNENAIRTNCPMRHENGNCLPQGEFCTAVSDSICEGLHRAYTRGENAAHKKFAESNDEMLRELEEYREAGTPEECISRKEWMSYSIDDIRKNFSSFCKEMREYVDAEYGPKKKGRPKEVHAHWKYWSGWMSNHDMRLEHECSRCGYKGCIRGFGYYNIKYLPDRCPSCNARMDEVSDDRL